MTIEHECENNELTVVSRSIEEPVTWREIISYVILPTLIADGYSYLKESDIEQEFIKTNKGLSTVEGYLDSVVTDSNVVEVMSKLAERSLTGIKKYNTTTDRDDLSLSQWITHAQEEAMDLAIYLNRIKKECEIYACD